VKLTIASRFNGPADSGNGGYSAGLVASAADPGPGEVVEVTLRLPPPLNTPLDARPHDGGLAVFAPDGTLVATAVTVTDSLGRPLPPVSPEVAATAAAAYEGFLDHPYPTCFVCGPDRPEGDGLRIFPGRTAKGWTAGPWRVPADTDPVIAWAALDCPGGWAIVGPGRPYVLGRMAAVVEAVPAAGSDCVLVGGVMATEGRKALVRTALYAADGDLLAHARATWIAI
jgi:hypothetical protein